MQNKNEKCEKVRELIKQKRMCQMISIKREKVVICKRKRRECEKVVNCKRK
jgi:hypothetical protein